MVLDNERARIKHLLRRAGFGATASELDAYAALGFAGTVDRLLDPLSVADDLEQRQAGLQTDPSKLVDIQLLWLYRMATTKRPLQEKMALFWHGLFATANRKVNSPPLMWRQYQLFLDRGLGNFGDLLLGVSRDPAMLIWLDGNANRRAAPNENYGRELLELFTLGIGNYAEVDVKAAARAFTGWFVKIERDSMKKPIGATFAFAPQQHDGGTKTFLGETGTWNGDDILRIILRQPACATFIARRLFAFFVWDQPAAATVQPFAEVLLSTNYDLRATLRAIFLSPEFIAPAAFHAKLNGPVELAVTTLRALGIQVPPRDMVFSLAKMGQELFNPPNVGGWPNGRGWISTSSLLERFNLTNRLITARGGANGVTSFDPASLLGGRQFATAAELVDYVLDLLVDGEATSGQRAALIGYLERDDRGQPVAFSMNARTLDSKVRGLLHLTMSTAQYQFS